MTAASFNTRWSLVEQAKGDSPQARTALSDLCAIYYAPVHAFVRGWCRNGDEAGDLTQAFFARLLEGRSLNAADASRGRFRSYLFGAVKHFIAEQHRREQAARRGGCADREEDPDCLEQVAAASLPPDLEFDRAWACALLDHTLGLLQKEQEQAGKAESFAVLKPWLAGAASHGDTAAAARHLGVSETAVRVMISRLRKRMREVLLEELAHTLGEGGDADAEMRHLAQALTGG